MDQGPLPQLPDFSTLWLGTHGHYFGESLSCVWRICEVSRVEKIHQGNEVLQPSHLGLKRGMEGNERRGRKGGGGREGGRKGEGREEGRGEGGKGGEGGRKGEGREGRGREGGRERGGTVRGREGREGGTCKYVL